MTIQWFPGHMAKARRQVQEKLKLIDVVIELTDARIPQSSRNPMVDEMVNNKPRLLLLNKSDMADDKVTSQWIKYYAEQGIQALPVNALKDKGKQEIIQACQELMKEKHEKLRAKGIIKPRAVRALILGIPNVGKSTLINRLASKNIAKTGDKPGVTKAQQWIKVGKQLELLDTPGILWPKFEDELVGYKLAVTGAIKDELLDFQDISVFTLRYLANYYPDKLIERYKLDEIPEDIVKLFDDIGTKRGCLMSGGLVDYDKTAEIILRDVRSNKLGHLSFERPNEK
ncbi:ribosome biogenesis GTPase YlqF [Bacillus solimangrovi]|uniref:Ribosome biogenesis GTPase A n=1 Tax=Bacillus solimangrovi TaxID=1305675 RepID=A0A1E5LB04_9BACI|nr:ribosome biogenesis GTPase YlqF [Bacillus solimangrovi]OEH91243.1 ribosome biogenesis GTPase YlqF [Bacillus solimangrovi]